MTRIANNPRATAAQIQRLAQRDMRAALLHPNCPLDLLLYDVQRVETVVKNPSWPLHTLSEPERCATFIHQARYRRAALRLERLIAGVDIQRAMLWALECVAPQAHHWRAYDSRDYSTTTIRCYLMRSALGLNPWLLHVSPHLASEAAKAEHLGFEEAAMFLRALREICEAARRPNTEIRYRGYLPGAVETLAMMEPTLERRADRLEQYVDRLHAYLSKQVPWVERWFARRKEAP